MDFYNDIPTPELLHIPSRSGPPQTRLEEHLDAANSLGRALWLMSDSETLEGMDARDRAALRALAGKLAEEISLALLNFYRTFPSKNHPMLNEEPQESA